MIVKHVLLAKECSDEKLGYISQETFTQRKDRSGKLEEVHILIETQENKQRSIVHIYIYAPYEALYVYVCTVFMCCMNVFICVWMFVLIHVDVCVDVCGYICGECAHGWVDEWMCVDVYGCVCWGGGGMCGSVNVCEYE